jgi:primosomal protein N' (replication factor Y)
MIFWVDIVVAAPAHSTIAGPLTYHSEHLLELGQLVRVPLGKREVLGVVWALRTDSGQLDPTQSKQVAGALDGVPPLSATWRQLIAFTAGYYQRALGEVALAALPPQLRELDTTQIARRLKRGKPASESAGSAPQPRRWKPTLWPRCW